MYIAKYQPQFGFFVAIDGFHNVPDKIPYVGLSCLNPPGALYQENPDVSQIRLVSRLDWESPITSPQFLNDFFSFKHITPKKNLNLIIEARTVTLNRKEAFFKTVGWTVLPIFNSNGYVDSGIYQLPILKGSIPKDLLDHITHHEAWPYINDLLHMKKSPVQLLEPMSVIVRLLDGQREVGYKQILSNMI